MDWIRRNWPDLLIAIALVAVIAGIIATLLSGGSLWPTSRGGSGNQGITSARSAVNGNGANPAINLRGNANAGTNGANTNNSRNLGGNLTVGNPPTSNSLAVDRNNVEVVSPSANLNVNANGTNGATLAAPLTTRNNGTSLAAPLSSPRAGSNSSISADINNGANRALSVANNGVGNVGNNLAVAGGVVSTNGVTIPNSANAASAAGSQQLAGRTTFASPQAITVNPASTATAGGSYKVSVGAFGVAANAQNLANQLNQQGYPVGFDQQGRLNVVYVGPFASQAEADAVSRQLRQAGQDTSVYADPQARAVTSNNNQQFANTAQSTQQNFQQQQATSSTVQTTAQAITPAGVGRSYLQVGAYGDVASSLPQRSKLEGLGLTVYDRREGGYVKLIVGPFAANEVGIYRSQLLDRGIDSFPVN